MISRKEKTSNVLTHAEKEQRHILKGIDRSHGGRKKSAQKTSWERIKGKNGKRPKRTG